MALDANIIFRGLQAGLGEVAPVTNLLQGVQTGQQLMRNNMQNQLLQQQMERETALAPLQQQALEQKLALGEQGLAQGDIQTKILQENLNALGVPDVPTAKEVALNFAKVAELPTVEAKITALNRLKQNAIRAGRTTENVDELLDTYAQSEEEGEQLLTAGIRAFEKSGFLASDRPTDKAPMQKAEGGMVFDPNTGTFSVDPIAKERLDELASMKAGEVLSTKDKQSLNKDLTSMTEDAIKIKRSAEELEDLKGRGSAASKLGAVFKFMKALDPTSVVRETEQGQVYAAEGAGAELAGMINSLLGKGRLTPEGFSDLVETSKVIANANIESVSKEVDGWLNTFDLDVKFKDKLKNRVPSKFDFGESGSKTNRIRFDAQGNVIP